MMISECRVSWNMVNLLISLPFGSVILMTEVEKISHSQGTQTTLECDGMMFMLKQIHQLLIVPNPPEALQNYCTKNNWQLN